MTLRGASQEHPEVFGILRMMTPGESTSQDLVKRMRQSVEAANSGDFELMVSFFDRDVLWDLSPIGLAIHTTNYTGIEEVRAAAQRLAGELG
jgi:hypothetical protein